MQPARDRPLWQTLIGQMGLILTRLIELRDELQKAPNAVGDGLRSTKQSAEDIREVIDDFEIPWPFWKEEALGWGWI